MVYFFGLQSRVILSDVESTDDDVASDDDDETISIKERLWRNRRRKIEIKRFLKDLETSDDESDLSEDEIRLKEEQSWKKKTHQIESVHLSLIMTASELGSLKNISSEQFKQILREKEASGECSGLKLIQVLVQTPTVLQIKTPSSNVDIVVTENVIFRKNAIQDRLESLPQSPLILSEGESSRAPSTKVKAACKRDSETQRNLNLEVQTRDPTESTNSRGLRKEMALNVPVATPTIQSSFPPSKSTLMASSKTSKKQSLVRSDGIRAIEHDDNSTAQTKSPRHIERPTVMAIPKKFNSAGSERGISQVVEHKLPVNLTAQLHLDQSFLSPEKNSTKVYIYQVSVVVNS